MGNSATAVHGDGDLYRDWPHGVQVRAAAGSGDRGPTPGVYTKPSARLVRRVRRAGGLSAEEASWLAGFAGTAAEAGASRLAEVEQEALRHAGLTRSSVSFAEAQALRDAALWHAAADAEADVKIMARRVGRAWAEASRASA